MLSKLNEKDFEILRIPLESGRQSPKSLAGILLLFVPFVVILFFVTFFIAGDHTGLPWKTTLMYIHLILSILIIVFSIIFSVPAVYRKFQTIQYFGTILITMITGISFFLCSILLLWDYRLLEKDVPVIKASIVVALIIGVIVFIVTWVRFHTLLKKGEYRAESKKATFRGRLESKSLIIPAIIIGTGLVLFMQAIFRIITLDGNKLFIIMMGPLLLYVFLFLLPEQIVIVYCKKRFKSFTFDEEGNLYPLGSGENDDL